MFLSIRKVSCHILTFTLILLAPLTVQAALVTSISALDVSGTSYDVTFYVETSFMQIWDADGDWIFAEGDASIVQAAPVFWGDQTGAQSAAEALAGYLSTVHWTQVYGGSNRDYITVPYSYRLSFPK